MKRNQIPNLVRNNRDLIYPDQYFLGGILRGVGKIASKVAKPLAKMAFPALGNMLLPGLGGMLGGGVNSLLFGEEEDGLGGGAQGPVNQEQIRQYLEMQRQQRNQHPTTIASSMGNSYKKGGKIKKSKSHRKYYNYATGGMIPLENDAVQFVGPEHENGGIRLTDNAEVEGGETMDRVRGDQYIFSNSLTVPGTSRTFAEVHRALLLDRNSTARINSLAALQERVSGRSEPARGRPVSELLGREGGRQADAVAAQDMANLQHDALNTARGRDPYRGFVPMSRAVLGSIPQTPTVAPIDTYTATSPAPVPRERGNRSPVIRRPTGRTDNEVISTHTGADFEEEIRDLPRATTSPVRVNESRGTETRRVNRDTLNTLQTRLTNAQKDLEQNPNRSARRRIRALRRDINLARQGLPVQLATTANPTVSGTRRTVSGSRRTLVGSREFGGFLNDDDDLGNKLSPRGTIEWVLQPNGTVLRTYVPPVIKPRLVPNAPPVEDYFRRRGSSAIQDLGRTRSRSFNFGGFLSGALRTAGRGLGYVRRNAGNIAEYAPAFMAGIQALRPARQMTPQRIQAQLMSDRSLDPIRQMRTSVDVNPEIRRIAGSQRALTLNPNASAGTLLAAHTGGLEQTGRVMSEKRNTEANLANEQATSLASGIQSIDSSNQNARQRSAEINTRNASETELINLQLSQDRQDRLTGALREGLGVHAAQQNYRDLRDLEPMQLAMAMANVPAAERNRQLRQLAASTRDPARRAMILAMIDEDQTSATSAGTGSNLIAGYTPGRMGTYPGLGVAGN